MLPVIRNTLINILRKGTTSISLSSSPFHSLTTAVLRPLPQPSILSPLSVNFIPNCGFKVRGVLKRRCKDCYFIRRHERLFVICKTHPRHKQMSIVKDPKNTWILTHATQSKVRPW